MIFPNCSGENVPLPNGDAPGVVLEASAGTNSALCVGLEVGAGGVPKPAKGTVAGLAGAESDEPNLPKLIGVDGAVDFWSGVAAVDGIAVDAAAAVLGAGEDAKSAKGAGEAWGRSGADTPKPPNLKGVDGASAFRAAGAAHAGDAAVRVGPELGPCRGRKPNGDGQAAPGAAAVAGDEDAIVRGGFEEVKVVNPFVAGADRSGIEFDGNTGIVADSC